MSITPTARRAERFAELLEGGRRTDDPVVAPFVALAGALQAVPAAAPPRPEFRDALRQRLMAVAAVQGVGVAATTPTERLRAVSGTWRFQRRMAVVAGSAAAVTAITGVGIGASRSLPGDPLYGVKRATEDAQLATTFGQEAKGKRHLQFARTRLGEVEALVGRSSALSDFMPGAAGALGPLSEEAKSSTILSTLRDMDAETRAGADALVDVYRSSGSTEPLRTLDTFTRDQFAALRDVLPALPDAARPRAEMSLSLLKVVGQRTVGLAAADPGTSGGVDGDGGTGPTPSTTRRPGHHHSDGSTSSTPGTGGGDGGDGTTGDGTTGDGSSSPAPQPLPLPTELPTIPPLPTSLPPILPTDLPTLPVLGTSLPLLG